MTRLGYYEMITTRGMILHPRGMVWDAVYDNEFVAEMRLLGHPWRLRSEAKGDGYGSQGTWYLGRAEALQRLAHQKLGAGAEAFKFVSRQALSVQGMSRLPDKAAGKGCGDRARGAAR